MGAIFKKYAVWAVLFLIVIVGYYCKNPTIASDYYVIAPLAVHESGAVFAGSTSCIPCHTDIYDMHVNTAHFNTSALADTTTVKGSFKAGHNSHILNDRVLFTMSATDSGLYQKATFLHNELELFNLRMDIVMGSGTKGQSFLHWKDGGLFQIHTSYFTPTNDWTRSPGLEEIRSPRPVVARCMECHSTYAKNTTIDGKGNGFDDRQMILGIDCERCHGPSAKHVGYHQKNPDANVSKYMTKHTSLSRQQRLDACALCHSGERSSTKPPFSFLVGDDLTDFLVTKTKNFNEPLDVHGNQYDLLTQSRCFEKSGEMNCSTCHNPHKNERGNHKSFNQKCISCHSKRNTLCVEDFEKVHAKENNCISCHMPLFSSSTMVMQLDSMKTAVQVRTHLIDIYP